MKTYWDTSAAMNAAINPKIKGRLDQGEHYTRAHTFAEFFGRMTSRGIGWYDAHGNLNRFVLSPTDAIEWLKTFAAKIKPVELDLPETLACLAQAEARNISGPRIHDLLHATAAEKAAVDEILTRDADFQKLSRIPTVKP